MTWLSQERLTDEHIRLEPLSNEHVAALQEAAAESDLTQLWYTSVPSPEQIDDEVQKRLAFRDSGTWAPYTIFDDLRRVALGMTGYLHIPQSVRRPEIGGTWMRASSHGSGANVRAKRLLLGHAFETLNCIAVEFRTHRFNLQSRRALEALGAQLDGILRSHFDAFGNPRDTCVYSITASEWSSVKRHLAWRLKARKAAPEPSGLASPVVLLPAIFETRAAAAPPQASSP